MPKNKRKNIVVLKDLPSNLVDEAIIILKKNINVRKLEYADNNMKLNFKENKDTNDYVIREAESIISNYINKIESKKKVKDKNNDFRKKYNRLKKYCICISLILICSIIKLLILA